MNKRSKPNRVTCEYMARLERERRVYAKRQCDRMLERVGTTREEIEKERQKFMLPPGEKIIYDVD